MSLQSKSSTIYPEDIIVFGFSKSTEVVDERPRCVCSSPEARTTISSDDMNMDRAVRAVRLQRQTWDYIHGSIIFQTSADLWKTNVLFSLKHRSSQVCSFDWSISDLSFWHSALKGVWLLQDSRDEAAEAPEVLLKLQQNEQNLRLKPTMSGGFCDPRRPWSSASSMTRQEWGVLEFLSTQSSYLDPPSSLLFLPAFRPLSCLPWIRRTA